MAGGQPERDGSGTLSMRHHRHQLRLHPDWAPAHRPCFPRQRRRTRGDPSAGALLHGMSSRESGCASAAPPRALIGNCAASLLTVRSIAAPERTADGLDNFLDVGAGAHPGVYPGAETRRATRASALFGIILPDKQGEQRAL